MRPFRRPEEALAVVRGRAARRQRRQMVLGAGVVAVAVVLVLIGLALRPDGDGDGDTTTPAPPTGVAPSIDRLEAGATGLPEGYRPSALAYGPVGFVAVTAQPAGEQNRAAPVWQSADGQSWEASAPEVFTPQTVNALAATPGGYLVAVTGPDSVNQLLVSTDALSWGPAFTLEAGENGASLRAAGNQFYRASAGTLLVSADGVTWTPTAAGPGPLSADTTVSFSGTEYLAITLAGDTVAAMWRSADGLTFESIPAPAVPAVSGFAANGGAAVIGYRGEAEGDGCDPAAGVNPDCTWPVSFVRLEPATGTANPPASSTFETNDPDAHLLAWPGGWMALAREGDEVAVWSSVDGEAWAPGATSLPVAEDAGAAVAGGGPGATAMVGGPRGDPPVVALITPG